jgi:hypothetical protein
LKWAVRKEARRVLGALARRERQLPPAQSTIGQTLLPALEEVDAEGEARAEAQDEAENEYEEMLRRERTARQAAPQTHSNGLKNEES